MFTRTAAQDRSSRRPLDWLEEEPAAQQQEKVARQPAPIWLSSLIAAIATFVLIVIAFAMTRPTMAVIPQISVRNFILIVIITVLVGYVVYLRSSMSRLELFLRERVILRGDEYIERRIEEGVAARLNQHVTEQHPIIITEEEASHA